jgi:dCTP diphosphatase
LAAIPHPQKFGHGLERGSGSTLDAERREQVQQEMADVLIYLVRLADVLGIDLAAAAAGKMRLNAAKYPADKAKGSAAKYSEL